MERIEWRDVRLSASFSSLGSYSFISCVNTFGCLYIFIFYIWGEHSIVALKLNFNISWWTARAGCKMSEGNNIDTTILLGYIQIPEITQIWPWLRASSRSPLADIVGKRQSNFSFSHSSGAECFKRGYVKSPERTHSTLNYGKRHGHYLPQIKIFNYNCINICTNLEKNTFIFSRLLFLLFTSMAPNNVLNNTATLGLFRFKYHPFPSH